MSNWQTRFISQAYNRYSANQGHGGYYGNNDPYYQPDHYDRSRQTGRPKAQTHSKYERKRQYRPSGRDNYYKSRSDQRDFGNGMYFPGGDDAYSDPYGAQRFPNHSRSNQGQPPYSGAQPPGYYNPSFNRDDEVYDNAIIEEPPPDFDSDDDKGPTTQNEVSGAKAPDPKPAKRSRQRPAWDVFAERQSDSSSHSDAHTWKSINAVMRLIFAVVFFFLITATAVGSRFTLLVMTYHVRPSNVTVARAGRVLTLKVPGTTTDVTWAWALVAVLGAPYLFTAFSAAWRIVFKKTEPLRCGPLMAAMLIETVHSMGLLTLVFYVLPSFDPLIGCLMLLNTAFFPGLIQIFHIEQKPQIPVIAQNNENESQDETKTTTDLKPTQDQSSGGCRRFWGKVMDVLMLLLQLGAMGVWSYRAYVVMDDLVLAVLTPLAMICTSISWWDNYVSGKKGRKQPTVKSDKEPASKDPKTGHPLPNGDVKHDRAKTPTAQKPAEAKQKAGWLTSLKRAIKKRRTKITLITSLWKVILSLGYPALAFGYPNVDCLRAFFFLKDAPSGSRVMAGGCSLFGNMDLVEVHQVCSTDHNRFYPLFVAAVNIGCSILCYKLSKSACKVLLQIPCFVLPLVLTPPLTLVLLLGSYIDPDALRTVFDCKLMTWPDLDVLGIGVQTLVEDLTMVWWLPAGLGAYLSLLYITGHVWNPRAERMTRTDRLFSKPLYCGALLDESLLLNRRRDEDDPAERMLAGQWLEEVGDDMNIDEARSRLRTDTTPHIYICATMWHESETEMIMMLKSIFRLDDDQCARKNATLFFNITDPDYYEFEAHIFFDDAFQGHTESEKEFHANDFVRQLVRVVDTAASAVHNADVRIPPPKKVPTPYGGRLVWKLPGGNSMVAHLKDKAKIRHRKRWSQVMYMYYFLGFKLLDQEKASLQQKKLRAEHTFLLALDGDVDFQPEAVQILVDRMKQTPGLGAACGRIHPIGSGPMVWYQKFEYAVSHWLQKATEHILGCVLCSPGCFSLFRGSALMDDNVMKRYTTPPTEARHYVQYDQGEDRWLCTLLLQQGYRVEYCAASDSFTFAPEGFNEFYNQRRRWTPSTMANIMDLLSDWRSTTANNQDISVLFIIYQAALLASGIITPGTIFLLIVGAVSNATQDAIPLWTGILINAIPIFIFVILCFKADGSTQLAYAGVLSILYTILMMLALVGIIRGAAENGFCSVSTTFLIGVVSVFVITALLHMQEFTCVLHGFLYFVSIPSMSMLLLIYSLANLHVVSWGTREVKSAQPPPPQQGAAAAGGSKQDKGYIQGALARLTDSKASDSDYTFSFGNLFRCLCCPKEDTRMQTVMQSIQVLDGKMTEMAAGQGDDDLGPLPSPGPLSPQAPKRFSAISGAFEGAKEKVKPLVVRDDLKNPFWSDDVNLGKGNREFIDDEERDFWVKFIGQYLYPLDKDDKHEKAVKEELLELRNKVSLAFLLINTLFVVLISALQIISENTTNLSVQIPCGSEDRETSFTGEKIEPISVTFTLVFGIMLTLQFLAMLFHRYSTMLHIISITKINFKRLTRQVLRRKGEDEEAAPTSKEAIALAREMQAIHGEDPAADYPESEPDTPVGTAARKSGSQLWGKLNARAERGARREVTLSRAFMKNFEKLASQIRTESTSESTHEMREGHVRENFGNFNMRSRSTLMKLARNDRSQQHILKRANNAKRRWKRAVGKITNKYSLQHLVKEAKEVKEEQEQEQTTEHLSVEGGRPRLTSSPRVSPLGSRRPTLATTHEDYEDDPFPGYLGSGHQSYPTAHQRYQPRNHDRDFGPVFRY